MSIQEEDRFVDPLALGAATEGQQLPQLPKGGHNDQKPLDLSMYRQVLHNNAQPQWVVGHHFLHGFAHPQWRAEDPSFVPRTTAQAALASNHACATCKYVKENCVCVSCTVCHTSVGRMSRHHCRRCWKAVCGGCRSRTRYLNAMSWVPTQASVCDTCALLKGLAFLTEDSSYVGVALLKEAMDAPRQCVDRDSCGAYSYRLTCPSCSLPTVPSRPSVERLVRIDYCCSMGRKCVKCSNAESRMREQEKRTEMARFRRFEELTPEKIDAIWASGLHVPAGALEGALRGASDQHVRDVVLALLASSVCYEYAAFPQTTLELSDVPAARHLLRLKECKRDYSIIEGPGDVVFVAFPGTHDLRTAMTDVKFARVHEYQFGYVNNGLARTGPSQPLRSVHGGVLPLWSYRVHEGFYTEEQKLRLALPTAAVRAFIAAGKRIVFCGHSLGGALAMLVTLRHLTEDLGYFQDRVKCVTFGAPLVGNSALAIKVRRCGWTNKFTHLIYRSDIVPRLLTERDVHRFAVIAAKNAVDSTVSTVRSLFGRIGFGGGGASDSATAAPPATPPSGPTAAPDSTAVPRRRAANPDVTTTEGIEMEQPPAPLDDDEDTVRRPNEDERATDPGFTASGTTCVLEKRAFDCFGTYHMLQRNVPYKATTNHLAAFNALRDGDGAKVDVNDHLLDSYNKGFSVLLRAHSAKLSNSSNAPRTGGSRSASGS